MQNFIGKDGFIWWLGVVEDRDDPLGLNRVRVRIFGHHTENKQDIPTADLSWAHACHSPNTSMTDGTPLIGDYVFGFFTDGLSAQAPVIIGVFPGIVSNSPNDSTGFSEGDFYKKDEPTTSRLHRNEKIDETIIGKHNLNLDIGVETADENTWDEPPSLYNAKIPYNRVTETEGGHVFELDDTKGFERIQLSHPAGTFFEISPDGTKVTKVSGKNYEIFLDDHNIHVKGVCNITVDGDTNLYVKGNVTELVDGDVKSTIHGNVNQTIDGNVDELIHGNVTQKIDGDVNETVHGHVTQIVEYGNVDLTVRGDEDVYGNMIIRVHGNVTENVGGNYILNVGKDVIINGKTVNINHGTKGAARIGDTADTGDAGTGGDLDNNSAGTNVIETGSGTVFIGD
jgi:hypothetical protein